MTGLRVAPLDGTAAVIRSLGEILVEAVAAGASVSFMHPLPTANAEAFWQGSLRAASEGDRIVFGAWSDDSLVGTVTLLLALPPNQPHRAEISKLITRLSHRGKGVARALMLEAERAAIEKGRTLLTLDTAVDGGAAGLYEGLGYSLTGEIPDFALKPYGGLTGTLVYWKRIGGGSC